MSLRHLRTLNDITSPEFQKILEISHKLKAMLKRGERPSLMQNMSIALLFEKPSLRTRISFEAGMVQLGGQAIYLTSDVGWKKRESVADFARVLAQYCEALVCRANCHDTIEELASHNCIPIINGLTDVAHPCQAIADLMTMQELTPSLHGKRLVFVGDANNVARSVMHACAHAGVNFTMFGPDEYGMQPDLVESLTAAHGIDFVQTADPKRAMKDVDFIYTDVWVSMGQEAEADERKRVFKPYQLNADLMALAPAHAKVLHCLPAHRGSEITDDVIDGCNSIIFEQAGNRMHAQKGLLIWLALQNRQLDEKKLAIEGLKV